MRSRRVLTWAGRGISLLLILGAVVAVLAGVIVPRIAGATPYTVMSGSMEPGLAVGALVVVRPVAGDDIAVGDIITFQLESGEPTVATHRVISTGLASTGEIRWQTQGDANDQPDALPVRPVQVKGEAWYSVPHLGHVNTLIEDAHRAVLITATASALLLYAAVMAAGTIRDRIRSQPQGVTDGS